MQPALPARQPESLADCVTHPREHPAAAECSMPCIASSQLSWAPSNPAVACRPPRRQGSAVWRWRRSLPHSEPSRPPSARMQVRAGARLLAGCLPVLISPDIQRQLAGWVEGHASCTAVLVAVSHARTRVCRLGCSRDRVAAARWARQRPGHQDRGGRGCRHCG